MAGQRLTDKSALTSNTASGDLFMVVDVSDSTGSAAGTSKKVAAPYVINTATISLTSANVNDLDDTKQTLVAAPGSGYFLQPITITCICTHVSQPQANQGYLEIGYTGVGGTNYLVRQRDFYKDIGADCTFVFGYTAPPASGSYAGTINNVALQIGSSAAFSGDWTMKVHTTYQVVSI